MKEISLQESDRQRVFYVVFSMKQKFRTERQNFDHTIINGIMNNAMALFA